MKILNLIINNKKLIHNFSYLSLIQLINMLLPMVIYPYLIRVLGSEKYGLIVYSQAIIGYLVVVVGFGLNIIATKEISVNREDSKKISRVVSSVYVLKFVLFLFCFLLTSFVFVIFEIENKIILYCTMWMCLQELLVPICYFHGMEKMKYIAIITLISKIIFLCLILVFINEENHYLRVPLFNGVSAILVGLMSIFILKRNDVRFVRPTIEEIKKLIKSSYVMALAYASNVFKSNFNLIIIKFIFSLKEVAYFDLAMKIVQLIISFMDIVNQTIFPKMSREKNIFFLKKIIKFSMIFSIGITIILFIFSNDIILLLGGEKMMFSSNILKVLLLLIPIYTLGALLGRNCLIVHGFDKDVLKSMILSMIFYFIIIGVVVVCKIDISINYISMIYILQLFIETFYRYNICKIKKIY